MRRSRRTDTMDPRLRTIRGLTLWTIVVLQCMIVLVAVSELFASATGAPGRAIVACLLVLPVAVAVWPLSLQRTEGRRDPSPWWYWGALACLVAMALLTPSPALPLSMAALWGGTCAFVAPMRQSVPAVAVLLVLPWVTLITTPEPIHPAVFAVMWAGAVLFGGVALAGWLMVLWLWEIVQDAVYGEDARSRLAVTEERLRFSRDMHDLLGHSLSALATKSELASRLAERAPERAAVEISEVRALARESLSQVRSAVRGYREVDLAEEVENVRGVLAADGVRVRIEGLDRIEPSLDAAALAAWVVREAGTNVLRHSDATECRITFTRARDSSVGPDVVVVEVANDRARADPGEGTGSGLAGLRERVSLGGGTLSASSTRDGGFLLRAVVPG
ncbi:sensor histidine kinase [Nocardiopsis salina]|uniref:sensor histidine kinase n=1 Tax=Nocardiopsis salina TaxID=245836 RepID=UPI000345B6C3|nr:histidine kinase [Nocardiopsis salina]